MTTKYTCDHKKIKDMINKMMKETNSKAVVVTELAKELKMDSRTLKKHLEVMEIDKYGYFTDKKKRIFIKNKTI